VPDVETSYPVATVEGIGCEYVVQLVHRRDGQMHYVCSVASGPFTHVVCVTLDASAAAWADVMRCVVHETTSELACELNEPLPASVTL
jgi:hypothetical protein